MKIHDDTPDETHENPDDNPDEDPSTRRSLRIKIRLEPGTKNNTNQPSNDGNETVEKNRPAKKKKKPAKKQSTEQETITELKKIIKVNEELIEEDDIRIKKLEDDLDNTLNRLENTKEENFHLATSNKKLEDKVARQQEEIASQQELIKKLETEQKTTSKVQNEKLLTQIKELDKITTNQERTIETLKEELDDTRNKFTELEALLDTMRHRNNLQERRIEQLKRTLSSDDEKQVPSKKPRQDAPKEDPGEPKRTELKMITPESRENIPPATFIPPRQYSFTIKNDTSPENTPPKRQTRTKTDSQSSTNSDNSEARKYRTRSPMRGIEDRENTRYVRPRVGLIMDSNGKGIINELRKHQYKTQAEYINIPEMRTIEDLRRIPRNQPLIDELRTLDQILIMQGTNNIKRGDDPDELADNYNQVIIEIARRTNTGIKTIEIPPIDPAIDPRGSRKAETFNKLINKSGKHIRLKRIKGEKTRDILTHDGIHITEIAAMKIARDIKDQSLNPENLEPQRKILIPIPPEVISRIIGKRGAAIRRMEEQFRVRIVVDQNTAIIRGEKRKEAAQEIREEIENAKTRALYD